MAVTALLLRSAVERLVRKLFSSPKTPPLVSRLRLPTSGNLPSVFWRLVSSWLTKEPIPAASTAGSKSEPVRNPARPEGGLMERLLGFPRLRLTESGPMLLPKTESGNFALKSACTPLNWKSLVESCEIGI